MKTGSNRIQDLIVQAMLGSNTLQGEQTLLMAACTTASCGTSTTDRSITAIEAAITRAARALRAARIMRMRCSTTNANHTQLFALFDQVRRFVIEFGSRVLLQLLVSLHGVCISLLGFSNGHTGVVACKNTYSTETSVFNLHNCLVLENKPSDLKAKS